MELGFCDGVVVGCFSGALTPSKLERSCMGLTATDLQMYKIFTVNGSASSVRTLARKVMLIRTTLSNKFRKNDQ